MDEMTFVNRVRAGEVLALGEWRGSKAEMLKWRDKNTGRAMEAPILRHTVEFGDQSVAVSERLSAAVTKLEEVPVVPFHKGDRVVLQIQEWKVNLGLVSARGVLEPFTNGSPGPTSPPGTGPVSGKGADSRKP